MCWCKCLGALALVVSAKLDAVDEAATRPYQRRQQPHWREDERRACAHQSGPDVILAATFRQGRELPLPIRKGEAVTERSQCEANSEPDSKNGREVHSRFSVCESGAGLIAATDGLDDFRSD